MSVELHDKDQSRMNQGWSDHDFYEAKSGILNIYHVEPILTGKIKITRSSLIRL